MVFRTKRLVMSGFLLTIPLSFSSIVYAAKPMDLSHQKVSILQSILSQGITGTKGISLLETSRNQDRNKTLHVRLKQDYQGYPVWGGDAILHLPKGDAGEKSLQKLAVSGEEQGFLNGKIYLDLDKDLQGTPAFALNSTQAKRALTRAITQYQEKTGHKAAVSEQASNLIVYVDEKNKAHWAYLVRFYVEPAKEGQLPAKPAFILDAQTLATYVEWNDLKTAESVATTGGGNGGNKKMGKLIYDGLKEHLPSLAITRDASTKTCSLKNDDVTVKHYRTGVIPNFACAEVDPNHNSVYWDGEFDAVNGGYSPDNDALFGGIVIKKMYQEWYGQPVLTENGKPMMLNMVVHAKMDNAYWDGKKMTFGDGISMFYPLTSLGVAAHEISHGFTEQHSNLTYYGQSGGMNESFSDMAAQAAEFYAYGKNSWEIGPEIFKAENEALRYMDQPSKDCKGKRPGNWCSIDDASQYSSGLDVHFSSGVYNRFFYLLGTTEGWDARKAFEVMVQANMNYWTPRANFVDAACGTIKAARGLGYNTEDVIKAFTTVKIDTSKC